jgi:hypothetical protein
MVDEVTIVNAVRKLVVSGHYRDEIPGLPGLALAGGGTFREDRRLYHRGTKEFQHAADNGLLDRLPPPRPPASPMAIAEAESMVGAHLPPLADHALGRRPSRWGDRRRAKVDR